MALRVKVSANAAAQVRNAATWWAKHRTSAPGAVGADFGAGVTLLAEHPGIGAKYNGSKTLEVRRLFLSRIGYFVYYYADADDLNILAFWHARRERQPPV